MGRKDVLKILIMAYKCQIYNKKFLKNMLQKLGGEG